MKIRKIISLLENENTELHQAIADEDWQEAFSLCDTAQEVASVIEASGARQVRFNNPKAELIWILGDHVIVWDGTSSYAKIETKNNWLYDIDPEDYFPDRAADFNKNFWVHPVPLYHATTEQNVDAIEEHGLLQMDKTRGLNNRGVSHAVFTTTSLEFAQSGTYGDCVFEINTQAMKSDGYMPYVGQEPPIVEAELRNALAHIIGDEDFYDKGGSDMSDETIIIYGKVPLQYLTLID